MSDRETKRQFGVFYRKRKLERSEEKSRLATSMCKFLKLQTHNTDL